MRTTSPLLLSLLLVAACAKHAPPEPAASADAGTVTATAASASAAAVAQAEAVAAVIDGGHGPPTPEQIQSMFRMKMFGLRKQCWVARKDPKPGGADIDVHLTLDASGNVTSSSTSGNDPGGVGACLEKELHTWNFGSGPGSVTVPFHFVEK